MIFRTYSKKLFWFSALFGTVLVIANLPGRGKPNVTGNELTASQQEIAPPKEVFEETRLAGTGEHALISQTGRTMIVSGRRYVKIDQKWVLERQDHIYFVNGVKTYFIDRPVASADDKKAAELEKANQGSDRSVAGFASNVFKPYTPEEIGETMKKLNQAKKQIEARDKILKELSRPEK